MENNFDPQKPPLAGSNLRSTSPLVRENDSPNAVVGSEPLEGRSEGNELPGGAPISAIEESLMNVAEQLGTWLGTAERRAVELVEQKKGPITDQLVRIRDTASRLLADLAGTNQRSNRP